MTLSIACCCAGEGVVHDSVETKVIWPCLPPIRRTLEAAGHAFFDFYEYLSEESEDDDSSPMGEDENEDKRTDRIHDSAKRKSRKKKDLKDRQTKTKQSLPASVLKTLAERNETLYEIMLLSPGSSQEEIKKKYKQLVLDYHPDKQKMDMPDDQKENMRMKFIRVQEAFEVLSVEDTRRVYDSSLDFQPKLPTVPCKNHSIFFQQFGEAFSLWGRYSIEKPLPNIGDNDTPLAEVVKFYDFYKNMISWRDYGFVDEYDIKDASHKDEKLWMTMQNRTLREAKRREDLNEFNTLLKVAEKHDPRMEKYKKEMAEKAEIAKKLKEEKDQLARHKAAENLRDMYRNLLAPKVEMKSDNAEADREKRETVIKNIADMMRERGINKDVVHHIDIDSMIRQQMWDLPKVLLFFEEMSKIEDTEELQRTLSEKYQEHKKDNDEKHRIASNKKKEEKPAQKSKATWTAKETEAFIKGYKRFPGGTQGRWQKISDLIGTKSLKEVQERATEMNTKMRGGGGAAPAAGSMVWTPLQQKALEAALKKYPTTLDVKTRWQSIGGDVEGKTAKECLERTRELQSKGTAAKGVAAKGKKK